MNISQFTAKIGSMLQRSTVEESLEMDSEVIRSSLGKMIDNFATVEEAHKEVDLKSDDTYYKYLMSRTLKELPSPKKKTLAATFAINNALVLKNIEYVDDNIDDLNSVIVANGLSVNKAVTLYLVAALTNYLEYTSDFMNAASREAIASMIGEEWMRLSKTEKAKLSDGLPEYVATLKALAIPNREFVKQLDKHKDVIVTPSTEDLATNVDPSIAKTPIANTNVDFVGSPIFHGRMWWAEVKVWRYKRYNEKVKQTKLYLTYLRNKMQDTDNPALIKEIEYTEDRIAKYEYKMKKLRGRA